MAKTIAVSDEQGVTGLDRAKATPARLMDFLKDVRAETRKVVSPSRAEVQATTIVVLVTVFVFAGYFWLVDNVIGNGIEALLHNLSKH
ncbi:MAG TPA: preprotein translocase subunit SecE [Granulicella sp.]|jgi:preprotein translocase subunit SecE|nr:preprotein translocase subunit SecE [Granulicella sp.]